MPRPAKVRISMIPLTNVCFSRPLYPQANLSNLCCFLSNSQDIHIGSNLVLPTFASTFTHSVRRSIISGGQPVTDWVLNQTLPNGRKVWQAPVPTGSAFKVRLGIIMPA